MPHEVMQVAVPENAEVVAQAMENSVLRRYAEVCAELLQRAKPLSMSQAWQTLVERARHHGLATTSVGRFRRLSELAVDGIAGPWSVAFSVQLNCSGMYRLPLDGVSPRHWDASDAPAFALAIALLFDSCDEAFRQLESPQPPADTRLAKHEVETSGLPPGKMLRAVAESSEPSLGKV